MLGVVACVLAVVCKRMQQLPTMFGPTVHRGKDTTHKSLLTMRNECAWPNNVGRAVQTNPTLLRRFGDHGTKEILGVVGWKLWPVSNFAQQHPTTWDRVCKPTQHATSNNAGSYWPTMLRPFPRGLRLKDRKNSIFGKIFILLYLKITYYRDMQLTCVSI